MPTTSQAFARDNLAQDMVEHATEWGWYEKRGATFARRVDGAFTVFTSEGEMICEDGWLAIDTAGNPYPISAEVFQATFAKMK